MNAEEKIKTPYELFGDECGDGWKPLIRRYFNWLEVYNKNKSDDEKIDTFQIKEKFGRLTIYPNRYVDELHNLIQELEEESANICEKCGSHIDKPIIKHHWIYPLCENCFSLIENKK